MPQAKSVVGLFKKLQSDDIHVHQTRCAAVRNRNAHCMRCAEACTTGCITYDDNQLFVSPERCIGCGTCATACPTCALEAHNPTDADLLRRCCAAMRACDGHAVIACEKLLEAAEGLYDPEKVVGVTCLGRVEESLLVALALAGAANVTLVEHECAECPHASGRRMAGQVCDTANALLETWGSELRATLRPKLPRATRRTDKGYDVERRQFFVSTKDGAKTVAETTADFAIDEALGLQERPEDRFQKVDESGTLPQFVPDRRGVLLSCLERMGEPQDMMVETRLWGHVVIDMDACIQCRMCATFCPTGALHKFDDEDGVSGLEHYPSRCVKCRCCEDVCLHDALWISDEVFAVDLLSGHRDRYEMEPIDRDLTSSQAMFNTMKNLLGGKNIYER